MLIQFQEKSEYHDVIVNGIEWNRTKEMNFETDNEEEFFFYTKCGPTFVQKDISAGEIFSLFFNDELLDLLIKEINLKIKQRKDRKVIVIDKILIKTFLSIYIKTILRQQNNIYSYWNNVKSNEFIRELDFNRDVFIII
ncbi:hypothetical protein ABK040_003280 [Willaertia magna]